MSKRWPQFEMILVSFLTGLIIITMIDEMSESELLIPRAGTALVLYGGYLLINLTIIPVIKNEKKPMKALIWVLMLIVASIILLSVLPFLESGLWAGWRPFPRKEVLLVLYGLLSYGLYAAFREIALHYISRARITAKWRIILGRLAIVLLVHSCMWMIFYFGGQISPRVIIICVGVGTISIIAAFINVYLIFPKRTRRISVTVIAGLVLSLCITMIFGALFNFGEEAVPFFITCCAILLLIIAPLSWGIYRFSRDSIEALEGLETALGHSVAELEGLRAQIHPHFLFNTLNTLYGSALKESASVTAEGIQRLGDMMRFLLEEANRESISLEQEAEYLNNYISLQKMRTMGGEDLKIDTLLPEETFGHKIAPMLLLPLVENSFKHGIGEPEKSWIEIKLSCDASSLRLTTRNSTHHTDHQPERNRSIGLANVRRRLELLYPGRHQLSAIRSKDSFLVDLLIYY